VVIEVIVRNETDVGAGEAGKWEGIWDRLILFRPGKDFTRSNPGNAKVQASLDTLAE
jgi:hypothetical protein